MADAELPTDGSVGHPELVKLTHALSDLLVRSRCSVQDDVD